MGAINKVYTMKNATMVRIIAHRASGQETVIEFDDGIYVGFTFASRFKNSTEKWALSFVDKWLDESDWTDLKDTDLSDPCLIWEWAARILLSSNLIMGIKSKPGQVRATAKRQMASVVFRYADTRLHIPEDIYESAVDLLVSRIVVLEKERSAASAPKKLGTSVVYSLLKTGNGPWQDVGVGN